MKIKSILKMSFGVIVSLDGPVPASGVVGSFLTSDGERLYKVKGTPTNLWTEILLEAADGLTPGQEVYFLKTSQIA